MDYTGTGDKNCRVHQGFGAALFLPCRDSSSRSELIVERRLAIVLVTNKNEVTVRN